MRTWPRQRRGFPLLGEASHFAGLPAMTAVAASFVLGALVVRAPISTVAGSLLVAGAVVAWTRPAMAISACLIVASLHRGIFLYLRIEPAGLPFSAFDAVALLLLLASVSLAAREGSFTSPRRAPVALCAAMILAGLVIGVVIGAGEADGYEVARVLRLEGMVLCGIASALVAGHLPQWRKAVVRGLMGAAMCAAGQILLTFCWSLATGQYFWSLFPFGTSIEDLPGAVQRGNILALRDTAIPGFLILPGLSLLVLRFKKSDIFLLMFLVAGGLVWLSRGLWGAMFLTLLIGLAHRAASGRLSAMRLGSMTLVVIATVSVVSLASGGILGQRLGRAADIEGDVSIKARTAETRANLEALERGPGPLLFGLGTGVVTYEAPTSVSKESSALLENSVLGVWTNTGLLGLLGVTLLFFGAALRGWRLASDDGDLGKAALGGLSLALPVLWLQGLTGGIFTVPEPTLPLFLLAATVLVTPLGLRRRTPEATPPSRGRIRAGQAATRHAATAS